jgi:hypothetical protein
LCPYLAVARWTIPRKLVGELVVAGGDGTVDLEMAAPAPPEDAVDDLAVLLGPPASTTVLRLDG